MRFATIRAVIGVLLVAAAASASAVPRVFPVNSYQVELDAVDDPYLIVDGEAVPMAQGVLIFNTQNATIVRGALEAGVWIRIQFDPHCNVRRIWILTAEELVDVPMWRSIFRTGFVPPTCVDQN